MTSPNLLGDVMSPISRHWPSFKSFWVVELKTALYKGQTREQILRKSGLQCVGYCLKSWYDIKTLTIHESTYIELIFRKKNHYLRLKAFAKTARKMWNSQKTIKIGTLSQGCHFSWKGWDGWKGWEMIPFSVYFLTEAGIWYTFDIFPYFLKLVSEVFIYS